MVKAFVFDVTVAAAARRIHAERRKLEERILLFVCTWLLMSFDSVTSVRPFVEYIRSTWSYSVLKDLSATTAAAKNEEAKPSTKQSQR